MGNVTVWFGKEFPNVCRPVLPLPMHAPSSHVRVASYTAHGATGPDLMHFVVGIQQPAMDHRTYAKVLPNVDPSALKHSAVDRAERWLFVPVLAVRGPQDYRKDRETVTDAFLSFDSTPSSAGPAGMVPCLVDF